MRIVIDWAHRDHLPVAVYHRGRRGRVIVMSGFGDNLRVLPLVRPHDHVLSFSVGAYDAETFAVTRRLMQLFELAPERLTVLCNDLEQVEAATSAGLTAVFCNKNAFIDDGVFRPQPVQKRFDAVSNARLVKLKRVHLARLVGNLALIRGHELEKAEYDDPAEIPHAYLNSRPLAAREVVRVLSASHVGLALSAAEGACQASSEYLLCGLPVVSTPSRGGRDVFYDAHNSILCEAAAESVRDAVQHQIGRLQRGEIDPALIRLRHLEEAQRHRERFVGAVTRAFDDVGAELEPRPHFREKLAAARITPRYRPYAEVFAELEDR